MHTPERMARSLELARRNLTTVFKRTIETWKIASVGALNRFIAIGGEGLFPTPDNTYVVCWYRIGADQLMLVRGTMPKARYVSFCLYNVWMESLDYHLHTIHTNSKLAITRPDGSVRVVVAHRDPGVPNWIRTAGHSFGAMCWRWVKPESMDGAPEPTTRVVKLDDAKGLP